MLTLSWYCLTTIFKEDWFSYYVHNKMYSQLWSGGGCFWYYWYFCSNSNDFRILFDSNLEFSSTINHVLFSWDYLIDEPFLFESLEHRAIYILSLVTKHLVSHIYIRKYCLYLGPDKQRDWPLAKLCQHSHLSCQYSRGFKWFGGKYDQTKYHQTWGCFISSNNIMGVPSLLISCVWQGGLGESQ